MLIKKLACLKFAKFVLIFDSVWHRLVYNQTLIYIDVRARRPTVFPFSIYVQVGTSLIWYHFISYVPFKYYLQET